MENSKELLKEISAIRAVGDKASYDPYGKHLNTLYFALDEGRMYFNGDVYGFDPSILSDIKIVCITLNSLNKIAYISVNNESTQNYGTIYGRQDVIFMLKIYKGEDRYFSLYDYEFCNKIISYSQPDNNSFEPVLELVFNNYKIILQSSGLNTNCTVTKIDTVEIKEVTEAQYNALSTKDNKTLYCIPEE